MQERTFFNHPQVNSSSTSYSVSSDTQRNQASAAAAPSIDNNTSKNLGYGIGRLFGEAFDGLYNRWHQWWYPAPSQEMLAKQREVAIYRNMIEPSTSLMDTKVVSNTEKRSVAATQQTAEFYSPFNLTTLDGTNGFVVNGISTAGYLGSSVSTAGDINGDGKDDLVLGAPSVSNETGAVYVIFGQSSFPAAFNLTTLNGTNGFVVNGLARGGYLGTSASTAGDINDDGKDDLVLAAPDVSNNLGVAYVILGQSSFPAAFNLTTLNGTNGFVVNGITSGGQLGSVSTAGDINGDGKDDLVLGAPQQNNMGPGAAYVILGQSSFPASFNLTTLNGTNGFVVNGILVNGALGTSVSTAGDINNDGKDDLVLGAPWSPGVSPGVYDVGAAYVILGQSSFPAVFNLTTLNGTNGFAVKGISAANFFGISVSTAGDINNDGKDDLVLAADAVSDYEGAVYVIFGQSSFPATFNLTTLNGTNGFVINAISRNPNSDDLGCSVSAARDINDDGIYDLVLGANEFSNSAGEVYVIFGQSSFPAAFNLSTLNGTNGFVVNGLEPGGYLGASVSTAGDINNDGKDDLVLGAPDVSDDVGAAYVILNAAIPAPTLSPAPAPITINQAPIVVNPIQNKTVIVEQPFDFAIPNDTFYDSDGDSLSYSASQADGAPLPGWITFKNTSLSFSGEASSVGTSRFSLFATDPNNLSARADFSLIAENASQSSPSAPLNRGGNSSIDGIVGGVIGGGLGLTLLAVGLVYGLYKKRFASTSKDENPRNSDEEMTPNQDFGIKKKKPRKKNHGIFTRM
jgi:FG-GAP repeat/Putative Ig domain